MPHLQIAILTLRRNEVRVNEMKTLADLFQNLFEHRQRGCRYVVRLAHVRDYRTLQRLLPPLRRVPRLVLALPLKVLVHLGADVTHCLPEVLQFLAEHLPVSAIQAFVALWNRCLTECLWISESH